VCCCLAETSVRRWKLCYELCIASVCYLFRPPHQPSLSDFIAPSLSRSLYLFLTLFEWFLGFCGLVSGSGLKHLFFYFPGIFSPPAGRYKQCPVSISVIRYQPVSLYLSFPLLFWCIKICLCEQLSRLLIEPPMLFFPIDGALKNVCANAHKGQ